MRLGALYVLDEKNKPVQTFDLVEFLAQNPRVAGSWWKGTEISTVFLGSATAWVDEVPLLFESRVFGGALDGVVLQYMSWDEAMMGHQKLLARVQAADPKIQRRMC